MTTVAEIEEALIDTYRKELDELLHGSYPTDANAPIECTNKKRRGKKKKVRMHVQETEFYG